MRLHQVQVCTCRFRPPSKQAQGTCLPTKKSAGTDNKYRSRSKIGRFGRSLAVARTKDSVATNENSHTNNASSAWRHFASEALSYDHCAAQKATPENRCHLRPRAPSPNGSNHQLDSCFNDLLIPPFHWHILPEITCETKKVLGIGHETHSGFSRMPSTNAPCERQH